MMSGYGLLGTLVLISCYSALVTAFPEVGHWEVKTPLNTDLCFPKSVFEDTDINFKLTCSKAVEVRLSLSVYWSECANAFADFKETINNSRLMIEISSDFKTDSTFKMEKRTSCDTNQPVSFGTQLSRAGSQMAVLYVNCVDTKNCAGMIDVHVTTDIKGSYGYLSAIEYPLRTFYGVLSLSYALLGILWLCFTVCHWKDLLRIQYYISLMIFIGLVEQITLYGLYETLNRTGVTLKSALAFAIVVSCLKRTLARFLILIACVGYGITKSRLGTAYRRIIWICVVYFLFCLLDSGLRAFHPRFKPSLWIPLAGLPMIAVDLAILWWSFSYLVSTLRETRMRRNKVKHRLYHIFSALLIGVSLVSVICMCVSIFLLHWKPCTRAWRYIWFDETFWQLLFFAVLFAIVILWRPSSTNRLYARSAFLDPDVDPPPEDLEERLLDVIISGINDDERARKNGKTGSTEDEALRWAEENIPPSYDNPAFTDNKLNQGNESSGGQFKID